MRLVLAALLVAALVPAATIAQNPAGKSPENASYVLSALLDPVNGTIQGAGRLTWRNTTHTPAAELRFHMYWNAWRTPNSTYMREERLKPKSTLAGRMGDDPALIDLERLALDGPAGGIDLLRQAHYAAPDTGNRQDQTLLVVPLPRPILPGETTTIDMAWNAHVPRTYDRAGALGSYFFISQWFPKIAVFEDAGWNAHEFHQSTEFFADFGRYDVTLDVPAGWVVGATGTETAQQAAGSGRTTHRYTARDVHDFAWTTSPDFLDVRSRFEEPGLPPVDLRLLLQRGHKPQAERHIEAARAALKYFGHAYGPYSYPQLTIVDPVSIVDPVQGEDTGGMEYPTLVTAGTDWTEPWGSLSPAEVVIHEIGHQWWYGIVATNEVEHAWMDEGLTTYATARAMAAELPNQFVATERYFGGLVSWPYLDVRWSRDVEGNRLNGYRTWMGNELPSDPSWRFWPPNGRTASYNRTALWLTTLERLVGEETMDRILRTYFERGAYRHPAPDEFFAVASEVADRDLTWFFDSVYRQPSTFDYAVADVNVQGTDTGAEDTTIRVRRLGSGAFPVDVEVTFDNGDQVTESWDGAAPWHALRYRRNARPVRVEIDPRGVLALDAHRVNNSWTAHPAAAAAGQHWAVRWFTWFQHVLLDYAFFA